MTACPGKRWLKLSDTPLRSLYAALYKQWSEGSGKEVVLDYRELFSLVALVPEHLVDEVTKDQWRRVMSYIDMENLENVDPLHASPQHFRHYQRNGLAWLKRLHFLGIGGILADDMGLGKTHQGAALLSGTLMEDKGSKQLVVCPASVLLSWQDKIHRFFPDVRCSIYHGTDRQITEISENNGVTLTSYGVIRRGH